MINDDMPPVSEAQSDSQTMENLLAGQDYTFEQPQRGDIRNGTVVWVGPNEIGVDIGVKREGVVNAREIERLRAEGLLDSITIGTELPVYVVKPEDQDGNIAVSIYLARREAGWQVAKEYQASQKIYESQVSGYNKGGLVVPFEGLSGFVPASQVVGLPRNMSEEERMQRLAQQVGRPIVVQVIEVDRKRKRLVLSEEMAQRAWREQRRREIISGLAVGQVVHGVVRSLTHFGAFVDLGGVDGLIHLSELSWQPVRHPNQVVRVGDEVDGSIVHLDPESGKIGLSLRQLQPDPWTVVESTFAVGQRVRGTVTNLVEFGAFVRLDNGIEGLVHISELADTEINHPGQVVARGQSYVFEVIRIDPERRRIGLSLRRVPPAERQPAAS